MPVARDGKASGTSGPLLTVRGLSKRFGGLTAVEDVDFDLYPGEILGIIGPNGAGKTTTFNLLAGALAPTAGTIKLGDIDILGFPPHRIAASRVMRTYQHNRPFAGLSVLDNVLVARIRGSCTAPSPAASTASRPRHAPSRTTFSRLPPMYRTGQFWECLAECEVGPDFVVVPRIYGENSTRMIVIARGRVYQKFATGSADQLLGAPNSATAIEA
jgi:energy-coupling factor transporter ATP-binding protein EcfA2